MADIHPVKLVFDISGNVIALAEYVPGDTIPTSLLNLNVELDGGSITDRFRSILENVDGGVFSDNFTEEMMHYDGGSILR